MINLRVLIATATLVLTSSASAQSPRDADLQAMEAELTTLRQRFTDLHPDVVSLLRRIEAHKSDSESASPTEPDPGALSDLQAARVRLAELRRRYTDKHAEVQTQLKLIEQLEQEESQ